MSADAFAVALVVLAAVPSNLFVGVYAFRPWRSSLAGQGVMTAQVALVLLIDISLLYKAFGDDYYLRDVVRLSVYALVAVSQYLMLASLLTIKRFEGSDKE